MWDWSATKYFDINSFISSTDDASTRAAVSSEKTLNQSWNICSRYLHVFCQRYQKKIDNTENSFKIDSSHKIKISKFVENTELEMNLTNQYKTEVNHVHDTKVHFSEVVSHIIICYLTILSINFWSVFQHHICCDCKADDIKNYNKYHHHQDFRYLSIFLTAE